MRKLLVLVALLIFVMPYCYALEAGERTEIYSIEKCDGDILIKLRGEKRLGVNEYIFDVCTYQGGKNWNDGYYLWKCPCNDGPTKIYLTTAYDTKNVYDIVLEYNITSEGKYDTRTINLNNIPVGPQIKKKEPYDFTGVGSVALTIVVIMVILIVLVLVGLGAMYVYRLVMKDDEEDLNFGYGEKHHKYPEYPQLSNEEDADGYVDLVELWKRGHK